MLAINQIIIDGPDNSTQPMLVLAETSDSAFGYAYYTRSWSQEITKSVPKQMRNWLSTLTHRASESNFVNVEVSYTLFSADGQEQLYSGATSNVVSLDYQTPFWVLLIGIGTGAGLLTVLLVIVKSVRYTPSVWIKDWSAGVVSGVIILLTTQFTKAVKLPVTIDVRDFYGAIVLGLLSWKMIVPLTNGLGLRDPGRMFSRKPHHSTQPPAVTP